MESNSDSQSTDQDLGPYGNSLRAADRQERIARRIYKGKGKGADLTNEKAESAVLEYKEIIEFVG
jgi:hypothetical protein